MFRSSDSTTGPNEYSLLLNVPIASLFFAEFNCHAVQGVGGFIPRKYGDGGLFGNSAEEFVSHIDVVKPLRRNLGQSGCIAVCVAVGGSYPGNGSRFVTEIQALLNQGVNNSTSIRDQFTVTPMTAYPNSADSDRDDVKGIFRAGCLIKGHMRPGFFRKTNGIPRFHWHLQILPWRSPPTPVSCWAPNLCLFR